MSQDEITVMDGSKCITNQLKQDRKMDQLSLFDPRDLFTGSK